MKRFFECVIKGAGTALGVYGMNKLIKTLQNPVKKAALKRKFTNIKNEIFKKDEE